MSLAWGLLGVVAIALAASFAARRARRALAAGLVSEICEILTLIEGHDLEAALARCRDGGAPPSLPALPTLSYRTEVKGLALLGAHVARLAAAFYGAAAALQDELRGLASEAGPQRAERARFAADELTRTFELGDETLRVLRDILSRRCRHVVSRA
jgi:hypothetical protein